MGRFRILEMPGQLRTPQDAADTGSTFFSQFGFNLFALFKQVSLTVVLSSVFPTVSEQVSVRNVGFPMPLFLLS